MKLTDKVTAISGVGAKRAELYGVLGIDTVGGLLRHYPRSYIDFTSPVSFENVPDDEPCVVEGTVKKKLPAARIRQGLVLYKIIMDCGGCDSLTVVLYNNRFAYSAFEEGRTYRLYGRVTGNFVNKTMNTPMVWEEGSEEIRPVYPLTEGLTNTMVITNVKEALQTAELPEFLPEEIRAEYDLMEEGEAVRAVHFPSSAHEEERARYRLGFDELIIMQAAMSLVKQSSGDVTGCAMKPFDMKEFYGRLPFEPTGAQQRAVEDIMADMQRKLPMNRLVQGDVGSGKTMVAAAACWLAYKNGCQSALMAPTEILARQHYSTLKGFLEPMGVNVGLLTGSMSQKEKRLIKEGLATGEINAVTGTHALISESTEFDRLGLVITDEQHRFGVNQRKMFAMKGERPHKLVMSATPIPRTLALIMYGDLDISVINEMPKGRIPVETHAVTGKLRSRALGFVKRELDSGRQGYIVCPKIEEGENGDSEIQSAKEYMERISAGELKGYSIGLLHGKMTGEEKEQVMTEFKEGRLQLLVSTTVIEVGVDVPNASIIMIESADRFGLSQLHQLRGRVGRGRFKSYCVLVTDNLNDETRERLRTISSTNDGFAVAEADLRLRGAGDFFGSRQSGLTALKIADLSRFRDLPAATNNALNKLLKGSPDMSGYPELKARAQELLAENGSEGMN